MSERKIERVVFTATRENRYPGKADCWFDGDELCWGNSYKPEDIYTREVFYAEPEPEPVDLREMIDGACIGGMARKIFHDLRNRIEAQCTDHNELTIRVLNVESAINSLHKRLDTQEEKHLKMREKMYDRTDSAICIVTGLLNRLSALEDKP